MNHTKLFYPEKQKKIIARIKILQKTKKHIQGHTAQEAWVLSGSWVLSSYLYNSYQDRIISTVENRLNY
jgi:hypothetical protein